MNLKKTIAASILSADLANLAQDVTRVLNAGADIIHFDVMDNHYVPNLTFGPMVRKAIRPYVLNKLIDVHLMVSPVESMIESFASSGADIITFHIDASTHVHKNIQLIKSYGLKAGVVLNPSNSLHELDYVLSDVDVVLLMSVNPGFGGQKFIHSTLNKIKKLRKIIDMNRADIILQVDGGINLDNIKDIANAGADCFVMGSAIFECADIFTRIIDIRDKLICEK